MMKQYMKLLRRDRKRRAFTLIELLIVILVLAILMAVALPLYLAAVSDLASKDLPVEHADDCER